MVVKGRYSSEVSRITNKTLYKTKYVAYFYNESEKQKGLIIGKPFTFYHIEYSKKEIGKYLKSKGYEDYEIIDL